MSEPPKRPLLEPLRNRVRRIQLALGLGFLAYALGAIVSANLLDLLGPAFAKLPPALGWALSGLFDQLWAYTFVPLFCLAAGRAFEVKPWPTVLGVLATGVAFFLGLIAVSAGLEAFTLAHPMLWVGRLAALVGAAWLSRRALLWGQALAVRSVGSAQKTAEENAARYEEMMREAERLAARHESPAPPAPPSDPEPKEPRGG